MIFAIIIGILLLAYLIALIFEIDIFTSTAYIFTVGWFIGFRLLLLYIVFIGVEDLFRSEIFQGLVQIVIGGYCFYLSVREINWKEIWLK
jgi:hypothetical protein